MSLAFLSHLENAVESLRSNRLRTLLTITGVTVGVASIVSVLSLASGANSYLSGQTTKIRDTVALIRTTTPKTSDSLLSDSTTIHLTNTLTATDVATLTAKLDAPVAPVAVLHAAITSKGTTVDANASTIVGTNQHLATIADLTLLEGDFITDQTEAGIVLGNQLAIDLFGTDQAIGNVILEASPAERVYLIAPTTIMITASTPTRNSNQPTIALMNGSIASLAPPHIELSLAPADEHESATGLTA
jgi:putative ABC transport system permease protein